MPYYFWNLGRKGSATYISSWETGKEIVRACKKVGRPMRLLRPGVWYSPAEPKEVRFYPMAREAREIIGEEILALGGQTL